MRGPRAEASLLRSWLATRLERGIAPVVPAGELGVLLDGAEVGLRGAGAALPATSSAPSSTASSATLSTRPPLRPARARPAVQLAARGTGLLRGRGFAPELVPSDELADCAATVLAADGNRILSYGTGFGYTPLRELLAEQLGVHPYRVLLTNGWLQGFRMLLRGRAMGQNVVCEYPTYDRALESIFQARANLLYLDLHPGGFADDQLEYLVRTSQKPALAYTNPTFHNPTGESLSEDKRLTLGEWLHNRAGVPLVEDDSYGLLRFDGAPLPTMFELSRQTIIYSTSYSATIAPGLRVACSSSRTSSRTSLRRPPTRPTSHRFSSRRRPSTS